MLQTANRVVSRIMGIARELNGVISGEHGIGITKLEYLSESELAELKRLRKENAELKMDREILLKASVFFAKETNR